MKLTSTAFEPNGTIPAKYTCDGKNVNPPLQISGVPQGAKSLALLVDDPDAPVGDWVHWLVWNIDPAATEGSIEIAEATSAQAIKGLPQVVEGTTDFGKPGWGGPCPPNGQHRYFFKLFALDTQLSLPEAAGKKDLLQAIEGHVLEKAELVGLYDRVK